MHCCAQVSAGEVRLLLPCGEASSQDAQRRLMRTTTLEASARLEGGTAPDRTSTMAVLVLGGFSACTAPPPFERPALQPAGSMSRSPDDLGAQARMHAR